MEACTRTHIIPMVACTHHSPHRLSPPRPVAPQYPRRSSKLPRPASTMSYLTCSNLVSPRGSWRKSRNPRLENQDLLNVKAEKVPQHTCGNSCWSFFKIENTAPGISSGRTERRVSLSWSTLKQFPDYGVFTKTNQIWTTKQWAEHCDITTREESWPKSMAKDWFISLLMYLKILLK